MKDQHETLEQLKQIGATNQRRLNEIEFAVHKFTRSVNRVEECRNEVAQLQIKLHEISHELTQQVLVLDKRLQSVVKHETEQVRDQTGQLALHLNTFQGQ